MSKVERDSRGEFRNNAVEIVTTGEETASETRRDENVESVAREVFVESPINVMPTLPPAFKSLVAQPISIADKDPRTIIALLGHYLGVDDYETNLASFWFLDFVALEVLRSEGVLSDHGRSLMVSWLAGEMQLIRENRLSHEKFWDRMRGMFAKNAERISRGRALCHWESAGEESSVEVLIAEENTPEESRETEVTQPKPRHRTTSKLYRKRIPAKDGSMQSAKSSEAKVGRPESFDDEINIDESKIEDLKVLDTIAEATCDMYGNTFHYALIVAAFIEPVPIHDCTLPFKFRLPRPLKTFDPKNIAARQYSSSTRMSKGASKKTNEKKSKKSRDTKMTEIGQEPIAPVVTGQEEVSTKRRQYILPLMEANEAPVILEKYKASKKK